MSIGKIIAVIIFIGGAMVVRSLLTPQVNMIFLSLGGLLIFVAVFLFFKELKNI